MKTISDQIISYREMCDIENKQTLQRGMNYRLNSSYSVVLMSRRDNAPYIDRLHSDGITIEYEGHDAQKRNYFHDPKLEDQPKKLPSGKLNQNGLFIKAVEDVRQGLRNPEIVKVYEKIMVGVWSLKGYFNLVDYKVIENKGRKCFRFIMKLSDKHNIDKVDSGKNVQPSRLIPSEVKKQVWMRDNGMCVLCGATENLHFDHDLPYSKGGTSLTSKNVRLLCIKHNLQKSAKIE